MEYLAPCPHCGKYIRYEESQYGKETVCRECGCTYHIGLKSWWYVDRDAQMLWENHQTSQDHSLKSRMSSAEIAGEAIIIYLEVFFITILSLIILGLK